MISVIHSKWKVLPPFSIEIRTPGDDDLELIEEDQDNHQTSEKGNMNSEEDGHMQAEKRKREEKGEANMKRESQRKKRKQSQDETALTVCPSHVSQITRAVLCYIKHHIFPKCLYVSLLYKVPINKFYLLQCSNGTTSRSSSCTRKRNSIEWC
jgi:hypothetical protein